MTMCLQLWVHASLGNVARPLGGGANPVYCACPLLGRALGIGPVLNPSLNKLISFLVRRKVDRREHL